MIWAHGVLPQFARTVQKPPVSEYFVLSGVAQHQRRHSSFILDTRMVIEGNVSINQIIRFFERLWFAPVGILLHISRCHCEERSDVAISRLEGKFIEMLPKSLGLATPACGLVRNDRFFDTQKGGPRPSLT